MTTATRAALGASVQSTQMDAAESVAQLKAARQLGETLSQSARQQGAQGLHSMEASQALQRHTEAMDPAVQGKYTGAVGASRPSRPRAAPWQTRSSDLTVRRSTWTHRSRPVGSRPPTSACSAGRTPA